LKKFVYGIDVGGTNIKIGLFEVLNMNLLEKIEIDTPKKDQKISIFQAIFKAITNLNESRSLNYSQIEGIGLAVPCPVKRGYVEKCPNLEWNQFDIVEQMRPFFPDHVSIRVSNDANVAAFGENRSLEKPYLNAVFYTLGTGVGGGIIIDGKILEGGSGLGGEIGHMKMFDGATEDCGCGSRGCLEQICGTSGILNYAAHLAQQDKTILDVNKLTVKAVFDAAKKDDKISLIVVNRVAEYIAISASILAVVLDPEVFIIGGGISKAGDFLIKLIKEHYQQHSRFRTDNIPFILAKTGNDAGIIGAAYIAKNT
jgi:glucokinase